MPRIILLEAAEVGDAVDLLQRSLVPDTPRERTIEEKLLEEASLLLSAHLRILRLESVLKRRPYLFDCYEEVLYALSALRRRRDWGTLMHLPLESAMVRSPRGLVSLHPLSKDFLNYEHLR